MQAQAIGFYQDIGNHVLRPCDAKNPSTKPWIVVRVFWQYTSATIATKDGENWHEMGWASGAIFREKEFLVDYERRELKRAVEDWLNGSI